jgi:hemolysin-activating ACP:hemolysin acyltransferase
METNMKNFLAIYTGSAAAMDQWNSLDEKTRQQREQAGMQAWQDWATGNAKSIVDQGAPLGKTKRITAEGVSDIRNAMAAYTVVQAESHEAAARMFQNHPHFSIFPGDGVEVMECLPMPER